MIILLGVDFHVFGGNRFFVLIALHAWYCICEVYVEGIDIPYVLIKLGVCSSGYSKHCHVRDVNFHYDIRVVVEGCDSQRGLL